MNAKAQAVIAATIEALQDRLESLEDVDDTLLKCAINGNFDGYMWGLIEQASHTLWFGAGFESPADLNHVIGEAIGKYVIALHGGKRDDKFSLKMQALLQETAPV